MNPQKLADLLNELDLAIEMLQAQAKQFSLEAKSSTKAEDVTSALTALVWITAPLVMLEGVRKKLTLLDSSISESDSKPQSEKIAQETK